MAFAKLMVTTVAVAASTIAACGGAAFDDMLPITDGDAASDAGRYPDSPYHQDARVDARCGQPAPACDPGDESIAMATPCPSGRECYERGSTCAGRVRCMRGMTPVWGNNAGMLEAVNDGGGFQPAPPPGSQCNAGAGTWTYSRSTGKLGFRVCDTEVMPYAWVSGSRALTSTERASVEAAASALTLYEGNDRCGSDKQLLTVAITLTTGKKITYSDAFYACLNQPPYVQNIDGLFTTLRQLAGE